MPARVACLTIPTPSRGHGTRRIPPLPPGRRGASGEGLRTGTNRRARPANDGHDAHDGSDGHDEHIVVWRAQEDDDGPPRPLPRTGSAEQGRDIADSAPASRNSHNPRPDVPSLPAAAPS